MLIVIGCSDGHDIKAGLRKTDHHSIDDYHAYTKCLRQCAVDVGCSGVNMDSDGECHLAYGVTSGSTPSTVIEVKHAS